MTPQTAAALRALVSSANSLLAALDQKADIYEPIANLMDAVNVGAAVLTQEGAETDGLHVVNALTQFSKRLRYGFQDYWADQLDTLMHSLFTQPAAAEPRAAEGAVMGTLPDGFAIVPMECSSYCASLFPYFSQEIYRAVIRKAMCEVPWLHVRGWSCRSEPGAYKPCVEWCRDQDHCPASFTLTPPTAAAAVPAGGDAWKGNIEFAIDCLSRNIDACDPECTCEPCPSCGLLPNECSGTECASTCQCRLCDHCRAKDAIDGLRSLTAPAPRGELCVATNYVVPDEWRNPPKWYSRFDIFSALRHMKYSEQIANELADWWSLHFQLAFNKGWQKCVDHHAKGAWQNIVYAAPPTVSSEAPKVWVTEDMVQIGLRALQATITKRMQNAFDVRRLTVTDEDMRRALEAALKTPAAQAQDAGVECNNAAIREHLRDDDRGSDAWWDRVHEKARALAAKEAK